MHHYWVGLAATLDTLGHPFGPRILGWVADGDILASGHAEAGNDMPIALSTCRAERVHGGWRLHGRKLFGSLGPVWDRMGFHAMDADDPSGPLVVHGFVRRDTPGLTVIETWDAHGMRATECHDTVFDGAFVPDEDVLCVVPAGPSADPVLGAMLVQQQVAHTHLQLDPARAVLDRLAHDWVEGVDHGPRRPVQVFGAKWCAASAAMAVVDQACEVVGGASFRRGLELERLSRDVRAARFHPGTDAFTTRSSARPFSAWTRAAPAGDVGGLPWGPPPAPHPAEDRITTPLAGSDSTSAAPPRAELTAPSTDYSRQVSPTPPHHGARRAMAALANGESTVLILVPRAQGPSDWSGDV